MNHQRSEAGKPNFVRNTEAVFLKLITKVERYKKKKTLITDKWEDWKLPAPNSNWFLIIFFSESELLFVKSSILCSTICRRSFAVESVIVSVGGVKYSYCLLKYFPHALNWPSSRNLLHEWKRRSTSGRKSNEGILSVSVSSLSLSLHCTIDQQSIIRFN